MPIHVHPVLRSLEEAEESAGLILTINSAGVTVQLAAETAAVAASAKPTAPPPANTALFPKVVPVAVTRIINGHAYTAS